MNRLTMLILIKIKSHSMGYHEMHPLRQEMLHKVVRNIQSYTASGRTNVNFQPFTICSTKLNAEKIDASVNDT